MSVAGIDVGNLTSCVALARKRGVDVIMNSESKRETPAIVSYGDKERFVGVDGAGRLMMNVKNTVTQVKRLIGRKFADPVVQKDIQEFMFKVTEAPDGGCLINVMFLNESKELTPEQVMTSLLKDLKSIAEKDQGSAISDCVISVPVYFTEAERLAMLNSANLAGLKCLRLMNEPTAAALNWGIFKSDLPEDKPSNVVFVDVGHSSLQVTIAAFKKGAMEVKAHTWDRSLGGRDLDSVLVAHFAGEFKAKTGLDLMGNAKARFRMASQAEKCRQMLTINPQAPISVECLMDDVDFRSEITRDRFEELAAPVLERVKAPCLAALAQSGLAAADVHGVEMVGCASRTPSIVRTVAEVFQQEPKRTMNSKECVSRGCSLQAAMLSPIFQVRHFDVKDLFPYKIEIAWQKDDGPARSLLFGTYERDGATHPQHLPSVKAVTFLKSQPFSVTASYSEDSDIGAAERKIAEVKVMSQSDAPAEATSQSCTVSFELDLHGLLRTAAVVHNYKVKYTEPASAEAAVDAGAGQQVGGEAGAQSGAGSENLSAKENGEPAAMETGAAVDVPVGPPKPESASEVKVKTKKVSQEAKFEQVSSAGMTPARFHELLEQEGLMAAGDALQHATAEAKNSLEEYVYALRSKVQGECADFVAAAPRDALVGELNAMEDWLYEEGEEEKKSVYEAKLKDLRGKGEPILLRFAEASTREPATQALSNLCQHNLQWCAKADTDPALAHISATERNTVREASADALEWLGNVQKAQAALGKAEDPAVLTSELTRRAQQLTDVSTPIMTKPVPPPAKKEEATKAEAGDGAAEPMEEDKPTGEGVAGAGGPPGGEAEASMEEVAAPGAADGQPDTMDE